MAINPEKEKAIELAMGAVERQFGKGSIMRLGNDEPLSKDVQAISTGSVSLDIALGVGGVPRGRIIEIFGPESSGKTTLSLHTVAEASVATSTRSTRWTWATRASSACAPTTCS